MASFWEVLRVQSDGDLLDDMMTYVSQPGETGRRSAVIVAHEALGVSRHTQEVADRLAGAGYFAVVPTLYHREGTSEGVRGTNPVFSLEDVEPRRRAKGNLRDDNIIRDINTTMDWLRRHPRVLGDRIGIVGFCMGGRVAYLAAAACPGLSAASAFYAGDLMMPFGQGISPFELTANIQCPLMGNFGELDDNPTVDEVRQIEAALQEHGKIYDFKMYPGVGARFCSDDPAAYHRESAEDALDRTFDWLQRHLAPITASA